MTGTVYSLGSILVDLTVDVPHLPERGGDVLATGSRTVVGGGFNLASAVARQGIRCVYAGPHGTGPYGDQVRAALAAEGIEVWATPRPDGDTGCCVTLVEPDGERTFVTLAGVEAELRPADLTGLAPTGEDVVALSGYDLAYPGSGPVLADWASGAELPATRLALDPGPLVADIPADRLAGILPRLTLLTLNQREARLLSGVDDPAATAGRTGAELLLGVRRLPTVSPHTLVVVREGAAGCVAAGGELGDAVIAVPAPAVTAVDTTGAGDTHTGVLLACLAAGLAGPAALERANRAAAVSVTRTGPATAPRSAAHDVREIETES